MIRPAVSVRPIMLKTGVLAKLHGDIRWKAKKVEEGYNKRKGLLEESSPRKDVLTETGQ